jgi:hypothetical protein
MNLDTVLYFANMRSDPLAPLDYWQDVYNASGPGGKFMIDLSKRLTPSRFVTRNNGEWSLPWKQELIPGFEMPAYDPTFTKTYEQVTDERALEIKAMVQQGKKFAVMYSGGMDSTCIVAALLKNLTIEELKSIALCTSVHAVVENPAFWEKYIQGQFKILDSHTTWYDDMIEMGYNPITGDEGDCIFGTQIGLQLYHNYDAYMRNLSPKAKGQLNQLRHKISDPEVHYSAYKDLIIRHFALDDTPQGMEFGRILYEKYVYNANTASVPVHSLHDFFWWLIFNVKYLNCSVRGAIYYNMRIPIRECIDTVFNWFNGRDYQLWSMANNNNGEKIRKTVATYKYAQRKYIYDFDKNEWYFFYKTKLESLGNLLVKGKRHPGSLNLGITKDYQRLSVEDAEVREFFKTNLINYTIDWC